MSIPRNSIPFSGWPSITDVPCPLSGCCGILRWAEAGYVPGYRICDGTTKHHFELRRHAADGDGLLAPNGRKARGYRTRAIRAAALGLAEKARISQDVNFGRDTARKSRTVLGIRVDACRQCGPVPLAAEHEEMQRLEPELCALAQEIKAALPDCSSLLDVFRDGTCHVYREKNRTSGGFGGTCVLPVGRVLALRGRPFARSEDFEEAAGGPVSGYRSATGYLPDGTIAPALAF